MSYDCLEVRNLLLLHSCPQGTGYGRAFEGLRCSLRCFHYAGLASNLVCALKQCFTGLPKRDISELTGSDHWEDRHLIISSNYNESFLFVSSVLKPSLEEKLSAVIPGGFVCLLLGSTSFLPVFLAVQ